MIEIFVENEDNGVEALEVPTDMGFNLMEILKASDYGIAATCGGMGLCATCHIEVLDGAENLPSPNDTELETLDTLPDSDSRSRLACQIRLSDDLQGLRFRIRALEEV